jgi:hypothetical protein
MPAPKFLAGLPKPVLFGLYGAVGGLLGALVFGEPLYRILTPAAVKETVQPQLGVAASPDVEVFVEGRNTFPVQIVREGFDGPVTVRMDGLPAGVSAEPVTIPAGQTTGAVAAVGAPTAPPVASKPVRLVVEATHEGKPVSAESTVNFKVTDPPKPLADIVLVLDTSVKMQWAFDELKAGIGKLADALGKARIDFRIALVTFQDRAGAGNTVIASRFGDSPFTANAAAIRDEVGAIKITIGSGVDVPQPSLEALAKACELPFRKDATKMLLLITDAPPKVAGDIPTAVRDSGAVIKRANIDAAHLVVWERDKNDWFAPLLDAGAQPGKFFSLKEVVVGDSGFSALLDTFGTVVSAAAAAKNPVPPQLTSKISEAPKVKSLQSSELTAAGTEGKLVVRTGVWTAAIAALVCLFLLSGQHHYLRGKLPAAGGIIAGLLGGTVVGLVGGAAGQGLYFLAPDVTILAHIFRVFGWALLGGLAGAGLALFIPNMKMVHGLAGGAIGGAAGAIGFIVVSSSTGDLVGRLVGGLILGFCIGLMVAIAETAFRQAWLEVRYGEREKITVTLGPEPVKVGSDAKACTVWARGAPAIALRFFVREGKVICDDTVTGRESAVADGFEKEVGTLTVTVRTGSGPRAPAAPSRPKPKPKQEAMSLDDDDGFDLPMPISSSPPPAPKPPPAPAAPPRPAPPPVPAATEAPKPQAAPPKPPAPPPRPAAPAAGSKPAMPPAPTAAKPAAPAVPAPKPPAPSPPKPPVPTGNPAIKPSAKNPDACPTCGRVVAGKPGARYCMICDKTY